MSENVKIDDKSLGKIVDFALKRFQQNSKYSAGDAKEAQARLLAAGLHDYLCSVGVVPNFEVEIPLDIEHSSLEDIE